MTIKIEYDKPSFPVDVPLGELVEFDWFLGRYKAVEKVPPMTCKDCVMQCGYKYFNDPLLKDFWRACNSLNCIGRDRADKRDIILVEVDND